MPVISKKGNPGSAWFLLYHAARAGKWQLNPKEDHKEVTKRDLRAKLVKTPIRVVPYNIMG